MTTPPLAMYRQVDVYVVYDRPRDFPDSIVVRRWRGLDPEWGCRLYPSLEEARRALTDAGLTPIDRMPGDDPAIAEVWL